MAARHTIERIIRDDDDETGQSVRQWKIISERGHVFVKAREGLDFLLIQAGDIDQLIADLQRAKEACAALAGEPT